MPVFVPALCAQIVCHPGRKTTRPKIDSQSDSQWDGFGWISGHGVDDQRRISQGKRRGGIQWTPPGRSLNLRVPGSIPGRLTTFPKAIMPLSASTRLGHYDVTALIGQGGMREVYLI